MAVSTDIAKTIEDKVRGRESTSLVVNMASLHAMGYALPLGLPFQGRQSVREAQKEEAWVSGLSNSLNQAPVTLRKESGGEPYTFPTDPTLAVSGKNVITRRYVAKGCLRGSVKESWSQDDYEITIAGVLVGSSSEELNAMVQQLRELCETDEALMVENEWLTDGYGITRIVIEAYSFPHTNGMTSQAYNLKCYSDESIKILEEVQ